MSDNYNLYERNETKCHEDLPVCPYCDYELQDLEGADVYYTDGDSEEHCQSCGKPFWMEVCVQVTYSSYRRKKSEDNE